MIVEMPLVFACAGETLLGVLTQPDGAFSTGVIFLIGGDQYRVGSHRQFRLLATALGRAGIASLRFDVRGMGDSSGEQPDFTEQGPDIAAAVNALLTANPALQRVVAVGLCDGASSALINISAFGERLAGICLLNPWARSEETLAATQVRHYYLARLLAPAFWHKLLTGRVGVWQALREFLGKFWGVLAKRAPPLDDASFQAKMAYGLSRFGGPVLLVLSGKDLTAQEFELCAASHPAWSGVLEQTLLDCHRLPEADHTFSSAAWRQEVEVCVVNWVLNKVNIYEPVDPAA